MSREATAVRVVVPSYEDALTQWRVYVAYHLDRLARERRDAVAMAGRWSTERP